MSVSFFKRASRGLWAALATAVVAGLPSVGFAQAATRGHVHGQVMLDVVIDGPTVVVSMEAPLDNFLGFERAPRTDAERKQVADLVAQLRAADQLFKLDPSGSCKLGPVSLRSPTLGLGTPGTSDSATGEGHADLDATFAFNCTNAGAVKFMDLDFFNAFRGVRQIDAQIAAPQGQFKRTLKKPNPRLAWSK